MDTLSLFWNTGLQAIYLLKPLQGLFGSRAVRMQVPWQAYKVPDLTPVCAPLTPSSEGTEVLSPLSSHCHFTPPCLCSHHCSVWGPLHLLMPRFLQVSALTSAPPGRLLGLTRLGGPSQDAHFTGVLKRFLKSKQINTTCYVFKGLSYILMHLTLLIAL